MSDHKRVIKLNIDETEREFIMNLDLYWCFIILLTVCVCVGGGGGGISGGRD